MAQAQTGRLIVFEGIDGTGKSTQVKLLAEHLQNQGLQVVTSFEPTNGPFGKQLRESATTGRLAPKKELELFLADRQDHVKNLIQPALNQGSIIILDRYYFSTMAYQGARGFDPVEIRANNEVFAPQPDLLFLLELPISKALERIGIRDGQGNDFEKAENLQACANVFDTITDPFCVRIDVDRSPADIHTEICGITDSRLLKESSLPS